MDSPLTLTKPVLCHVDTAVGVDVGVAYVRLESSLCTAIPMLDSSCVPMSDLSYLSIA